VNKYRIFLKFNTFTYAGDFHRPTKHLPQFLYFNPITTTTTNTVPDSGFKGLTQYWRSDLIAAFNGAPPELNIEFEISDIIFHEGAFMAKEVNKTSVEVIRLPFEIPIFILQKEGLF